MRLRNTRDRDHIGWYTKRDNTDPTTADEWPKSGRCLTFNRDFDQFVGRIERITYATTSYNNPEYLSRWHPCRYDPDPETTEWRGERDSATPPASTTTAIAAWGDVDLRDELKPKRGELDEETYEKIEQGDDIEVVDDVQESIASGQNEFTIRVNDDWETTARLDASEREIVTAGGKLSYTKQQAEEGGLGGASPADD